MKITLSWLAVWLVENPNYTAEERAMIINAVSQYESDCIDEEIDEE